MIPFIYKYRPQSIEDFELHSKSSLVYHTNVLLLGPERSGKTTLSSLLVQSIEQDQVLYINVLKEQGIQYYRNDVKTFCQSTTQNKKIIVDGLDEMNEQTQQIFLNYIDTYASIQFILTGTNSQKIMESIYSTCMVIHLKPVSDQYLCTLIDKIASQESITIEENAKQYFVSLQRAWDQGDLAALREFTTSEMFATIQQDLAGRTDGANQTDVVSINAQLLGIEVADNAYYCSVQFGGTIREQQGAPANSFSEIWNLSKPVEGPGGWVLAGIRQLV
jgi:replication-associated recombination protein RarA